eukprot:gene8054-8885_t
MLSIAARMISRSCAPLMRSSLSAGFPSQSLLRRPLPIASPMLTPVRGMANHRHKKIIKLAKGFRGRANRCYTVAFHRVLKARQYAYRDRKVKKRVMRSLWITRINAASRLYSIRYGVLINRLAAKRITLDRKVLAELAVTEPLSFKSVIEVAKQLNHA